jgi:hypothetical protein
MEQPRNNRPASMATFFKNGAKIRKYTYRSVGMHKRFSGDNGGGFDCNGCSQKECGLINLALAISPILKGRGTFFPKAGTTSNNLTLLQKYFR